MIIDDVMNSYRDINQEDEKIIKIIYDGEYKLGTSLKHVHLILDSSGKKAMPRRYGRLSISFNSEYTVENHVGKYSILSLESTNEFEIETFFNLCINYISTNDFSTFDLMSFLGILKSIFKNKRMDKSSIIGFLGELIFIKKYYELHNENILNYYQSTDGHMYDFISENTCVEIKTTLKENRIHRFNNKQLQEEGYICSIMLEEKTTGEISISSMLKYINTLKGSNTELINCISSTALSIPEECRSKLYDIGKPILLYKMNELPFITVNSEIITNVKYDMDLSGEIGTEIKKFKI